MKKIKLKIGLLFSLAIITTPIILSACANNNANTIFFATAQGADWPIIVPLNKAIEYYNQKFSKESNFLPVKLLDRTNNGGITTEATLLNDTINKITAKDSNTPSIILNTYYASAPINSYQRLLNVKEKLNPSNFANAIVPMYTKTTNSNDTTRLYSLPFNISSLETLVVNLPVLKFLIDLAVANGATLSDSNTNQSSVLSDLKKVKSEDVQKRLVNTVYGRYEPGSKTSLEAITKTETSDKISKPLSGYTINDDTFKYYDKMVEFGHKIQPLLKLKANIKYQESDPNNNKIANFLAVDYYNNIFNRFLWNDTGDNSDSFIWQYKNSLQEKQKNVVDYTFLKDKTANKGLDQKFIESFDKFVGNKKTNNQVTKVQNYNKTNGTRNIYYATKKAVDDWTYDPIRNFQTALGIAVSVGARRSAQTDFTKKYFATSKDGKFNEVLYNSWAKLDTEVKWYDQVMTVSKNSDSNKQESTYIAGGSSLTPISNSPTKDKATLKFLEWLYLGNIKFKNKEIPVVDFLEEGSGYFIPTAKNYGNKDLATKRLELISKNASGISDENILNATLALSIKDYLKLLDIKQKQPYLNDKNKSPLFDPAGDINTANFSDFMDDTIAAKFNKADGISGDEFLNAIKTKFKDILIN